MELQANRYFIVHKPYNMVSQFVSSHNVVLLSSINFNFPDGTHAIGRLDSNSEGLLILTTNKKVTRLLFAGPTQHKRTYQLQVKNKITEEDLNRLRSGVSIKVKNNEEYLAKVTDVAFADPYPDHANVFTQQNYISYTWLRLTLTEGKFHQVRKMIAAIGSKCIRLIRVSIEDLMLDDLEPGCVREVPEEEFFSKLKIADWR